MGREGDGARPQPSAHGPQASWALTHGHWELGRLGGYTDPFTPCRAACRLCQQPGEAANVGKDRTHLRCERASRRPTEACTRARQCTYTLATCMYTLIHMGHVLIHDKHTCIHNSHMPTYTRTHARHTRPTPPCSACWLL